MPDKESIAGTSSSSSFETTQSVAGNSALSNLRRTRSIASQLATVRPEHLDVAQPSSLPSLYIDGLRYVLEDWIHKSEGEAFHGSFGTANTSSGLATTVQQVADTGVQIHDTPRHICEYGVDMDAD
ncbi:uncharacterized protein FPOAC1_014052 [Fusarium poae]|uniref:uncharacterized protein n=1 Tax=Fusarium poae TaxID=36050 RepID=UPI001D047312|nr:uncharacterized protein FPOAC1_014052 [Fusarium poae]KAG8664159.1 hypothetical protein FPOAC1_014052 [Fusarium poae]